MAKVIVPETLEGPVATGAAAVVAAGAAGAVVGCAGALVGAAGAVVGFPGAVVGAAAGPAWHAASATHNTAAPRIGPHLVLGRAMKAALVFILGPSSA
jgi:hypothetical protein